MRRVAGRRRESSGRVKIPEWLEKQTVTKTRGSGFLILKEDVTPNFWQSPEVLVHGLLSSKQRLCTLTRAAWALLGNREPKSQLVPVSMSFLGRRLLLLLAQIMQCLKRSAFFKFTSGTS